MKRVITFFMLWSVLLFTNQYLFAQDHCDFPCNDSMDVLPAFSCSVAANSALNGSGPGFVCNLDGYCIDNITIPPANNEPFCILNACVLNHPMWISFVPTSDSINLDLCPSRWINGGDPQLALYDQCGDLLDPVVCHCYPPLNVDSIINISSAVTPGQTYYLVIDQYGGISTRFAFRLNYGSTYRPVGDLVSDSLSAPAQLCKYKMATLSSQGFQYASKYEWTIDGNVIGGDSLTVELNTDSLSVGTHSLCLKATNQCSDGEWKSHCWDIEVNQSPTIDTTGIICEGDVYNFRGQDFPPGNYRLFYSEPGTNACDTVVFLHVNHLDTPHYPDIHIAKCPDQSTIQYQGVDYPVIDSFYLLRHESSASCDTLTRLYVKNLTLDGGITSSGDTISCLGGSDTLRLDYSLVGVDSIDTDTENFWYDTNNELIGHNTDQIVVTKPGNYKVQLRFTILNPSGADQPVCELWLLKDVFGKDSPLNAPIIEAPRFVCERDTVQVNITNSYPPGTLIHWNLPRGYLHLFNDSRSAIVSFDSAGPYDLCIFPEDTCMPGPLKCVTFLVIDAPQILSFGQDSTGSLSGILSAIIDSAGLTQNRITFSWEQVSGPGHAVIEYPDSLISAVTVDTPGLYVFTLTLDYDGLINCTTTKALSFIFTGTGAHNHKINEDNPLASLISIYPNPVSKILFIQSEIPVIEMSLIGPDGRKLMKSKFKETFDVRNYPAGVYMLQFVTEKGLIIKKYIKK
jgi:hypothetical protein